jgi:Domain of unknown function (DUF5615)
MAAIRFFTDEDVYSAIATALRRNKIDACSTPEVGRRRQSDRSQLEWASVEGRVLVTFNVAHFAELHATWLQQGLHHAGIVVSNQRPIGDVVRRLLHLSGSLDAESMCDRLEFLGRW